MNFLFIIIKRFIKYIFIPLFTIAVLWSGYFLLYGNFHKVDRDLYRSAQLFSFDMPYYIKKYKIKSIINFRGNSTKDWYKNELSISKEYNVTHYDYGIGDRKVASIKEMNDIVHLMKIAPKPLLIHCKAGADRTSLASALYLYAIKGDKDASKAISIIYGHFPWLGSKTEAMDRSFKKYIEKYPIGVSN